MRKFLFLLLVLISSATVTNAQRYHFGAAYNYLFAPQWDKAIQTYNFSRPFLTDQQPLLMHGGTVFGGYFLKSKRAIRHGIEMSYHYFGSTANSENFKNHLAFHLLKPTYAIQYEHSKDKGGWYAEAKASLLTGIMSRKVNGSKDDDMQSSAFGVGFELGTHLGYEFTVKDRLWYTPFIGLNYSPYYYSPNSEVLLNQTRGLSSKTYTSMLMIEAGISIELNVKR